MQVIAHEFCTVCGKDLAHAHRIRTAEGDALCSIGCCITYTSPEYQKRKAKHHGKNGEMQNEHMQKKCS